MFFALLALRSIKVTTLPKPTTLPAPIRIPHYPVTLNDEEIAENEYVLEQIPGKNRYSFVHKFLNSATNDEEEIDEEDADLEVYYELEEIPGTNWFGLKKIWKKFGKVIKVATKVIKIAGKVYSVIKSTNDEENFIYQPKPEICKTPRCKKPSVLCPAICYIAF